MHSGIAIDCIPNLFIALNILQGLSSNNLLSRNLLLLVLPVKHSGTDVFVRPISGRASLKADTYICNVHGVALLNKQKMCVQLGQLSLIFTEIRDPE